MSLDDVMEDGEGGGGGGRGGGGGGAPMEVSSETTELANLQEAIRLCEECSKMASQPEGAVSAVEAAAERLSFLLRQYCERPRLLEPHLPQLLSPLVATVTAQPFACPPTRAALLYMYHVLRVRGYKHAIVHLPHEVWTLNVPEIYCRITL